MPAALAGALAFSAVSSIAGGFQARSAANQEAKLQEEQGGIALAEANANATNEAYNQRHAVENQRLAFLANGVTLEGSPSAVLEDSTRYGQSQVDAILRQGVAKNNLARATAQQTRNAGRAALIAGVAQGIGTAAAGANSARKSGIFDTVKPEGIMG